MNTKKEIENLIKTLNENPIYHMSLSSSELFHSNFIEWLFNHVFTPLAKEQFMKFFFAKGNEEFHKFDFDNLHLKREKLNTDISFLAEDERRFIIENKFKSYPTKSQLDKYKNDGTEVVLLYFKLAEGDFGKFEKLYNPKSYKEFIEELGKNDVYKSKNANSNHNYIKEQYREYLKNMIELFEEFSPNSNDNSYDFITANPHYNKLEEIRLRDIFFKIRNQELLVFLKDKLPNFHFEVNFSDKNSLITIWHKDDEDKIKSELKDKEKVEIEEKAKIENRVFSKTLGDKGIQIQEGKLRSFIIIPKSEKSDKYRSLLSYLDSKKNEEKIGDSDEKKPKKTIPPEVIDDLNSYIETNKHLADWLDLECNEGTLPFNRFGRFVYTKELLFKKENKEIKGYHSFGEILDKIKEKYGI
ncbi:MAG: PD-(D/E)XK nuclease family protein [Opitutales bacterium]